MTSAARGPLRTVAWTTALRTDEGPALTTATALAVAAAARLVTVHATVGPLRGELPQPERLATSWGAQLQHATFVHECCDDATDTLLDALRRVEPDLIVTGTHGRSALAHLFTGSIPEALARNVAVPTLFVPLGGVGLANDAGAFQLSNVVVPIDDEASANAALAAAEWLARALGGRELAVLLLHHGSAPNLSDRFPGLKLTARQVPGDLGEAAVELASALGSCAIVMGAREHDGLLDGLLGSPTEQVVRHAHCPVLSVPLPC